MRLPAPAIETERAPIGPPVVGFSESFRGLRPDLRHTAWIGRKVGLSEWSNFLTPDPSELGAGIDAARSYPQTKRVAMKHEI